MCQSIGSGLAGSRDITCFMCRNNDFLGKEAKHPVISSMPGIWDGPAKTMTVQTRGEVFFVHAEYKGI